MKRIGKKLRCLGKRCAEKPFFCIDSFLSRVLYFVLSHFLLSCYVLGSFFFGVMNCLVSGVVS